MPRVPVRFGVNDASGKYGYAAPVIPESAPERIAAIFEMSA